MVAAGRGPAAESESRILSRKAGGRYAAGRSHARAGLAQLCARQPRTREEKGQRAPSRNREVDSNCTQWRPEKRWEMAAIAAEGFVTARDQLVHLGIRRHGALRRKDPTNRQGEGGCYHDQWSSLQGNDLCDYRRSGDPAAAQRSQL